MSAPSEKRKDARPATQERTALLIFWAVPAVIVPGAPRGGGFTRLCTRVNESRLRKCHWRDSSPFQYEIEAPTASVAPVRAADRGDARGVTRGREPVVNGGANLAPLDGRLSRAMMPRDQQQNSVAARDRLLESPVDRTPRRIERHAVKVDHAVRLDAAA